VCNLSNGKVRAFANLLGQNSNKIIVKELIKKRIVPDVLWLVGDSGAGKSTTAELIALTDTCEEHDVEPCLKCPTCLANIAGLDSQGSKSRHIKKINLAELTSKKDVKKLIEEVFDLEPIPDQNTYYIFEELQELKDYQAMFLERLRDLPDGVHIIGCTTDMDSLSTAFSTRARLTLKFNKLNTGECHSLIERIISDENILNMTESEKHILISQSRHNARVIVNTLHSFKTFPDVGKILRDYYNIISPRLYIQILESFFKEFSSFVMDLDILSTNVNLMDFHKGMKTFLLDSIFYFYCGKSTLFTKQEKADIKVIMSQLGHTKARQLLRLCSKYCKNEDDVFALIISMHEVVEGERVTSDKVRIDAVKETNIAQDNMIKKGQEEQLKASPIKKLSLDDIANITEDLKGHTLETGEWE